MLQGASDPSATRGPGAVPSGKSSQVLLCHQSGTTKSLKQHLVKQVSV